MGAVAELPDPRPAGLAALVAETVGQLSTVMLLAVIVATWTSPG